MDLVMLEGQILTMDAKSARAEALAVKNGKFVAVGSNAEIRNHITESTKVVHLNGRTITPGFIDPHNHFSMTTFEPVSIDCRMPPLGKQSVLDAVAVTASSRPNGQWIWGLGYNAMVSGEPIITMRQLDEVAPDNPVIIMDFSYHACYANSAALKLAGIDSETPDPHKGWIQKGDDGKLNGFLWERAMDPVHRMSMKAHMEEYGDDGIADLVHQNAMRHLAYGITSIGDALTMNDSADVYRIADSKGKLPIAVQQLRGGDGFFQIPEQASKGVFDQDNVSDRLRGGAMKLFMDPVYPMYGMNHCDAAGHLTPAGEMYYTQEEVDELVLSATSKGIQVAIHSIGDRAIDQTLNSFERAINEVPGADKLRLRIEHLSFPREDQIKRAASMPIVISGQPPFLYSIGDMFQGVVEEFGIDLPADPYRVMVDSGATIAAGSDFPCAPLNPMIGISVLATRKTAAGSIIAPEQAISAEETLRQYTNGSAYAIHRDHEVGSIEVGKRADMVVLSHNPTTVSPDSIMNITVQQTYVDGDLKYERYA